MRAAVAEIYEALGNVRAAAELRSRSLPMSLDEQEAFMDAAQEEAEALTEEVRGLAAARDAAEDDLMELRHAVRAFLTAWHCWLDIANDSDRERAAELLEALVTP